MAPKVPYTFIQCPCAVNSPTGDAADRPRGQATSDSDDTFDPRAPRSNFSLYPLEYLLYCEICNEIRCPRCVSEEITTVFCPNCLFEVPNTNLRSDGNRCTRSCFQCPICVGPLTVGSLDPPPDPSLLGAAAAQPLAPGSGSYILSCGYCQWNSTDIGIRFDKVNGVFAQLARIRNGGTSRPSAREVRDPRRKESLSISSVALTSQSALHGDDSGLPTLAETPTSPDGAPQQAPQLQESPSVIPTPTDLDPDLQFAALQSFYKNQLAAATPSPSGPLSSLADFNLSSPGSLSRIMSMYTSNRGLASLAKKSQKQIPAMREASAPEEGLKLAVLDESATIDKLMRTKWEDTVTGEQQGEQVGTGVVGGAQRLRFAGDLRPVACLLRAKRSRRCPMCRHIITKPENKVANTRYRIRLVAGSYIPSISIRPLLPPTTPGGPAVPAPISSQVLQAMRPSQFLLKFRNPLFETVRVSLATPGTTPGRFASRVTVLCPQFEIDANTDMWDDALKEDPTGAGRDRSGGGRPEDGSRHQVEAGKIWDRGRNWVSIVVEIIPPAIKPIGSKEPVHFKEDEDLLEIPMFIRLEWEAEVQGDMASLGKEKEAKEKRELAYWCVLGIGRISQE